MGYWRRVLRRAFEDTFRFLLSERLGLALTALSLPIGFLIDWRKRGLPAMLEEAWINFAYWFAPLGILTFCVLVWSFVAAPPRMERDERRQAARLRDNLLVERNELRRRIEETQPSSTLEGLRIVYDDVPRFHHRASVTRGGKTLIYDCYFVAVQNYGRKHVARDVKVRITKIGNVGNFAELDLPDTIWFDPYAKPNKKAIDLAPGEMRMFQFAFHLVEPKCNFGTRFASTMAFAYFASNPTDIPTDIVVTAFSEDDADIAEFVLRPVSDGLPVIEPKPDKCHKP